MPRQPRLDAPGTLHHVMGRGIEHTQIFREDTDRADFVRRLAARCRAGHLGVYAWALMPNHFHLLADAARHDVETLRWRRKGVDLATLARRVIAGERVPERDLRGGSRRPAAVRSRRLFCQVAVQGMGDAGAAVVRFLGVTTSSVNPLVASEELAEVKRCTNAL